MNDVLDCLSDLSRRKELVSLTLSCRLGNPAVPTIITKTGTIEDIDINDEKPKQTSFYIYYPNVGAGGGVKFKAHPHEIITIFYGENIIYESEEIS